MRNSFPRTAVDQNALLKRQLNLLVVDDSKMNRKMIVKLMTGLGHQCIEAENGSAAVSIVRQSLLGGARFDAILMDNQMPVMLGTEATKIIREELGYQGLVLGVTGNVLDDDVKDFIAHGATDVIPKPLTSERFEEVVVKFEHLVGGLQSTDSDQRPSAVPDDNCMLDV
jgi:CheY-like chemotaxis protein